MGASRIGKRPIFTIQRIPAPYLCQYPYLFRITESIKREWNNAMGESVTPNCRMRCSGCGVKKFGGGVCYEDKN